MTTDLVAAMMQEVASQPPLLHQIVADGPSNWRNSFARTFKGLPVNDDIANRIFAYFCQESLRQAAGLTPQQALDAYQPPPAPPTEAEIAKSWVIESASSEEGRRAFYGSDHPQALLDRIASEDS